LIFYSYNVATSVMSVLFSEPQAGVFEAVRAWLDDRMFPRVVVPVVTSAVTTALIVWATARRAVNRHALDDTARFIIVAVAVIGANATLSFSYTKNDILSLAGAFYALAAYGAIRDGLLDAPDMQRAARVAVAVMLCLLSIGWTIRSAGAHYLLRAQAFRHQADWAALPGIWQRNGRWPSTLAEQRLIHQLRMDAVGLVLPNTRGGDPQWPARIWPN
jgi:hypothetical protein